MVKIKQHRVKTFVELHSVLDRYKVRKTWIFRGHANISWKLVPRIGRFPYVGVDEKQVFRSWKRRAIEYISTRPESDWDWLAIAQHHGLATRLLDWTKNPLFAAFFAVRKKHTGDAIIHAANFYKEEASTDIDPFEFKDVAVFYPKGVVPRITRQGGLFTIHGKPGIPIEDLSSHEIELEQIIIKESYRATLLSELSFYGINSATLFPDLDGLSAFLNWTIENREYWRFADEN